MDTNQRKELFSRAYVGALAAQVGFRSSIPDVDDDSIDLILKGRGFSAGIRNPQLEIQLKCTAKNNGCDDYFTYQLSIKNYNDLRGDDLLCPRYLFVLAVPTETNGWLSHEKDHTKLKHCCYWMSLSELPDSCNDTAVTLHIPKANLLTAESLFELMELASIRGVAA